MIHTRTVEQTRVSGLCLGQKAAQMYSCRSQDNDLHEGLIVDNLVSKITDCNEGKCHPMQQHG